MSPSLTGASGKSFTSNVIYSLQVTPLVVTSTQYSVVSVGVTVIFSVVSPVDQVYVEELANCRISDEVSALFQIPMSSIIPSKLG